MVPVIPDATWQVGIVYSPDPFCKGLLEKIRFYLFID